MQAKEQASQNLITAHKAVTGGTAVMAVADAVRPLLPAPGVEYSQLVRLTPDVVRSLHGAGVRLHRLLQGAGGLRLVGGSDTPDVPVTSLAAKMPTGFLGGFSTFIVLRGCTGDAPPAAPQPQAQLDVDAAAHKYMFQLTSSSARPAHTMSCCTLPLDTMPPELVLVVDGVSLDESGNVQLPPPYKEGATDGTGKASRVPSPLSPSRGGSLPPVGGATASRTGGVGGAGNAATAATTAPSTRAEPVVVHVSVTTSDPQATAEVLQNAFVSWCARPAGLCIMTGAADTEADGDTWDGASDAGSCVGFCGDRYSPPPPPQLTGACATQAREGEPPCGSGDEGGAGSSGGDGLPLRTPRAVNPALTTPLLPLPPSQPLQPLSPASDGKQPSLQANGCSSRRHSIASGSSATASASESPDGPGSGCSASTVPRSQSPGARAACVPSLQLHGLFERESPAVRVMVVEEEEEVGEQTAMAE